MERLAPGALRESIVTYIPECLRALGVSPDAFIAANGLDPSIFSDPEEIVAYADGVRALNAAAEATGSDHFGLIVGNVGGLHILGQLGAEMRKAKSVRAALRMLKEAFSSHDRGAILDVTVEEEFADLHYMIFDPNVTSGARVSDLVAATACMVLRDLCGPAWKPTRVLLARRIPSDVGLYRATFNCPLEYNGIATSVRFSSSWIGRDVYMPLDGEVMALPRDKRGDVPGRTIALCASMLLAGRLPTSRDVAEGLAISERTLLRRLSQHGETFSAVLTRTRRAAAIRLLTDTDLPLKEISQALGYSELSAFTRAFRAWTDTAPSHFRKNATAR